MARLVKLAMVVVVCMTVMMGSPATVEAVSCGEVVADLAPCLSYLTGGGTPSEGCCSGVRNLVSAATTTSDKQTACNCIKDAANNYNVNDNYAQALPTLCNANVPYKISRSTNCQDIRF